MAIIDDLKALVECESPTDDLASCRKVVELATVIAERVTGVKAQVIIENGRPIFWLGSEKPKVILLAHLDTVWPIGSFKPVWRIEGDIAFGPGTFDMKAGFLQALYAIKDLSLDAVALIATTDEETGSQTSREFIQRTSKGTKAVLVLEASINGQVKTARKGTAMYRVSINGKAAHAGLEPEKGINSTVEIAHQITKIIALENKGLGTTVVPTTLQSGTTTNTVPANANLDIDVRSFSIAELERVDNAIKALTPQVPGATIAITGGINRPPLEEKSTLNLYKKLQESAKKLGLGEVGKIAVGGASDGNFAAAAGAEVLDGLGAIGDGAHAPHEQISISGMDSQIKLLTQFVRDLLSE
jgi:glutamate carboxypeptidase